MPAPDCVVVPDGNCAPAGTCGIAGICSCELNSHWPGLTVSPARRACAGCAASLALAFPARPAPAKAASNAVMQSLFIALPYLHAPAMVGLPFNGCGCSSVPARATVVSDKGALM